MKLEMNDMLAEHEKDYAPDAWSEYTHEELAWWARLLLKRSLMRASVEKRSKDVADAQAYLLMLTNKRS